jgi:hypothetical protein
VVRTRRRDNPPPLDATRAEIAWAYKLPILLIAILLGAVAALLAVRAPASYSAEATIRVTLLESPGGLQDSTVAANNLAAQYSQLASSEPVLTAAAAALGPDAKGLGADITSGPVNSFNVIGITAHSSESTTAARQATAVAKSLVTYLNTSYQQSLTAAEQAVAAEARALNTQIAQVQASIADAANAPVSSPQPTRSIGTSTAAIAAAAAAAAAAANAASVSASDLASNRSLLASLLSERDNIFTGSLQRLTSSQPTLTLLNLPTAGTTSKLKTILVVSVAFVAAMLICVEIATVRSRLLSRRRENQFDQNAETTHRGRDLSVQRQPERLSSTNVGSWPEE